MYISLVKLTLNDLFRYDPEAGLLYRKVPPRECFSTDGGWKNSATKALRSLDVPIGYRHYHGNGLPHAVKLAVRRKVTYVHRIAWEICHGPIPDGMGIDHINGDPFDNRLNNLRLATRQQNSFNQRGKGRSGLKGATFSPAHGKWRSEIRAGRVRKFLGHFDSAEAAHAAYCAAAPFMHGDFARTK